MERGRNKICPLIGKWRYLTRDVWDKPEEEPRDGFWGQDIVEEHPTETRFRVKCPECKRRMWADTRFGHDAVIQWRIPPHKKRGWWKRPKQFRKRK